MARINNTAELPEDAETGATGKGKRATNKRTENRSGNSRTRAKEKETRQRNSAKPARGKGKPTAKETRGTKSERGENRAKKFDGITITMQMGDETKNKIKYVELDADGDAVENPFKDGRVGQIYLLKSDLGAKPPKTITVTIEAE